MRAACAMGDEVHALYSGACGGRVPLLEVLE